MYQIYTLFIIFLKAIIAQRDGVDDKLVFEDNFEGEEINPLLWDFELGPGVDYWRNLEIQYNRKDKENIYIKDNQLHIKAKYEKFENLSYTAAKLTTKNTFNFKYGKIETRVKLPKGMGIWPFFRLIGANIDEVLWPKCGQMNLIESKNNENIIYNTLHWENSETKEQAMHQEKNYFENVSEFQTYVLIWTEDLIEMEIDEESAFKIFLNEKLKSEAFQKSFFLTLGLAVSGDIELSEIDNSNFPLEMVVDYIKIYQNIPDYKYLKSLIFYDDFDEEVLNISKWTYNTGTGENGWGTFQKQYYTNRTQNLFLSNSSLHIVARKEYYRTRMYTSAKITTQNSLNFTYGIIHANISFPFGKGISSGLWLSGLYNDNIWPECGEFDALIGVYNSSANTTFCSGCRWGKKNQQTYYKASKYDITGFNEYTIFWDANCFAAYINDFEVYKLNINYKDFIAFHHPFFINLNLLVGGYTVEDNIDNSQFPLEMIVDYIKVYHYNITQPILKDNDKEENLYNSAKNNNPLILVYLILMIFF